MNINDLERFTGITKQNIRFYEKKGGERYSEKFSEEASLNTTPANHLNLVITQTGMYPVFLDSTVGIASFRITFDTGIFIIMSILSFFIARFSEMLFNPHTNRFVD